MAAGAFSALASLVAAASAEAPRLNVFATVTASSGLNVRDGPSASADKITALPCGATVLVTDTTWSLDDGKSVWAVIILEDGSRGFLFAEHLGAATDGRSCIRNGASVRHVGWLRAEPLSLMFV